MSKNVCSDCNTHSSYHINTWLEEIMSSLLPVSSLRIPHRLENWFDIGLEKFFSWVGLIKMRADFKPSEIQMRTSCITEEMRKRGITVTAAKGPAGYTSQFCAEYNRKKFRFQSLPVANHVSKYDQSLTDDKERTKKYLIQGNFPTADGQSFWFWQKKKALKFGSDQLGFPLVVKPRSGSISRHVTTNIENATELLKAINKSIVYSPNFVVEKFIGNSFVYRATVVDFNFVAVVKQIPANVVGDGISTVKQLIANKNSDPRRGEPNQKEYTLYRIVIDHTTDKLLTEKGYTLESVAKKDEMIYLQKNPFLKLGGDLIEVTERVHPKNINLFKEVASFFDIRVVGIDFMVPDIEADWHGQVCGVLELNSVPCIEMHHFPYSGKAQNVGGAVVDLFFKYYV